MNNKSIKCPYVYMHTTVHVSGHLTPCCNASPQDDIRWLGTKLSDGGLSAPYYSEIRDQMQNGEWPSICNICKRQEDFGYKSLRLMALENYSSDYSTIALKYIDIKFSSICNLSCRMCFPYASSLVEEYYEKFQKPYFLRDEDKYNENIIERHNQNEKLAYVKDAIENGLEVLKVTGGEPFASKEFINIIDWCLLNNYTNLELIITTNGTKLNTRLVDKLIKFKKVRLNLSIDGTKETYSYIRYKSNWNNLEKNIKKLKEISQDKNNIKISVSCLLMFYNILDIKNLAKWCFDLKIPLTIDTYIKPWDNELGVKFLPSNIINDALIDFKKIQDLQIITNINDVINFLSTEISYNEFMCKKLKETTEMFDIDRNQTYKCLDKRLVNFLDEIRVENCTS